MRHLNIFGDDRKIPKLSINIKDIVDYVLGKFSKEEREVLNNSCNVINSVIKDFINDVDVEKLKSRYN